MIKIEPLLDSDWNAVRNIYEEGIDSGHATFETEVPEWKTWDASHLAGCRFVARAEEGVLGWGALTPVSDRCVYGGVAEISVYVGSSARGRGVGRALLASHCIAGAVFARSACASVSGR